MNKRLPFRWAAAEGSDPRQLVEMLARQLASPDSAAWNPAMNVTAHPVSGQDAAGSVPDPDNAHSGTAAQALPTPATETTDGSQFGLVYLSDSLARHAGEVLSGLQQATGISHWSGCVGMALLAGRQEFYEQPAAVALVVSLAADQFRPIVGPIGSFTELCKALAGFLEPEDPGTLILHADPGFAQTEEVLTRIDQETAWFCTGGVASGQGDVVQFAGRVQRGGLSGLAMRAEVPVAVRHTQGCSPLPGQHRLTETWRNIIVKLDDQPALPVFKAAIGEVLARDLRRALGYIHIGLPISGSDTGDYRVRNIIGIDLDRELLAVGEMLQQGEPILFVRRDGQAAREDLERMLTEIHRQAPEGIRGALYVSCLGRGRHQFGSEGAELAIVQDCLGDVPLVGFFANGEIFANRLYGYTGVLTLFV